MLLIMDICTSTIKKLAIASVLAFFITYLVSLNIENGVIIINTKWLSLNFIFTITSGAFASLIIVLICEYIKYLKLKQDTEMALFLSLTNLYGQILILKCTCTRALHSHNIANQYLIQSTCNNISTISDKINDLDYSPLFRNRNHIKTILNMYIAQKHLSMKMFLQYSIHFQLAFKDEEINLLQQRKEKNITYDAPKVQTKLIFIINQTLPILYELDDILYQIDKQCDNRYHWQTLKQSLYTCQDNYVEYNPNH